MNLEIDRQTIIYLNQESHNIREVFDDSDVACCEMCYSVSFYGRAIFTIFPTKKYYCNRCINKAAKEYANSI